MAATPDWPLSHGRLEMFLLHAGGDGKQAIPPSRQVVRLGVLLLRDVIGFPDLAPLRFFMAACAHIRGTQQRRRAAI